MQFSNDALRAGGGTALALGLVLACSARTESHIGNPMLNSATGGTQGTLGSGGSAAFGGFGVASAGNGLATGNGGILIVPQMSGGAAGNAGSSSACPAIHQKPEQVTIYKPVALFIMQDRTGTMVSGVPRGCTCSWQNSTDALTAFVNDPASAGLDVGLGFFGGMDKTVCDGSDCGQAVVPIQPINMAGPPIISAMGSNAPNPLNITPLECGLRGMINSCLIYKSQSPTGEDCVAVLVTDGNTTDPTPCDANVANLVQIIADGKNKGVNTYTLGLQGSDPAFLDQIALAGGTMAHIDASAGVQGFVAALNSIRKFISVKMSLPCTWKIPAAPAGTAFDPTKVNVTYTAPMGAPQPFGHVNSQADCARATGDAWYYDNAADPAHATQVIACESSCSGTLHESVGEVDVAFGCDTIPAMIR